MTFCIVGLWIAAFIAAMRSTPDEYQAFQRHFGLDIGTWHERWETMKRAGGLARLWHLGALLVPLCTYKLLHLGPVHLFSNVFTFLVFGGRIEARAGWWRFLLFHEAVGMVVGAVELWRGATGAVVIGASASVAAVITAYLLLHLGSRIRVVFPLVVWPVFFEIPAVVVALCWGGLQAPGVVRLLQFEGARPLALWGHAAGIGAAVALLPIVAFGRARKGRGGRA